MKHLVWIIVAMMVLGAVVPGCDDVPRYDGRLTAADSLIHDHADSALTMLEALTPSDLATEGDRAYHDLLLTQARYKCYKTATTDSAINRALAYYRAHPNEREKLTRAYIYKGTVMEELGHPDSAMFYYKTAEATSTPDDYANLGQINVRIGALYRVNYADFQTCYEKYEKALHYYVAIENKAMQQTCLYNMAMCTGITHLGDPSKFLDEAISLAIELGDSSRQYDCKELLCRQLLKHTGDRSKAKKLAMNCLHEYKNYINSNLLLDISLIYAKDKMIDSSKFFLHLTENTDVSDQIRYRQYEILSIIARHEGDFMLSDKYNDSAKSKSENIENSKVKYSIKQIENQQNSNWIQQKIKETSTSRIFLASFVIITLVTLVIIVILFMTKIHRMKAINLEAKSEVVLTHQSLLSEIHSKNDIITNFIASMVDLMHSAVEASTTMKRLALEQRIKKTIVRVANEDFWNELHTYLDNSYNGLISRLSQDHPDLKEKDIKFIELSCCGCSYLEIAMILGYAPNYISRKRMIIANKLGLTIPLDDYLKNEMSANNKS